MELSFLNGEYRDLATELEAVRQGGLEIALSSPEHLLSVYRNRLALALPDDAGHGALGATFEIEFDGEGHLIAEIRGGGPPRQLHDDVTAERQTVRVAGRVRLALADDGYRLEVVEAPPSVALRIRSGLTGRIVDLCRLLAKIPFVGIDCGGLDSALSVLAVPLPGPGESFVLPSDRLTDGEKAFFERFLPK